MKMLPFTGKVPFAPLAVLVTGILATGCASVDGVLTSNARLTNAESLHSAESLKSSEVATTKWPVANWWTRYGDPQLDQLVAEALADNHSLHVAGARVRQALALTGIADAARSPQITGTARSTRQRFSEHGTAPKSLAGTWDSYNEATLNFSYEIDFWGRNRAAFQAALDRVRASEVDAQAARLLLASGVVQIYFRLAHAFQQRDLADRLLVQRQELLSLTRQRVAAGLDSEVELRQAESGVPSARQQVAAWQESIALVRNQLAALLGKGPDRGLALLRPQLAFDSVPGLPSRVSAELLGRRPDVVAQRWRVQAASRDIEVAQAQFYPNVSLTLFAGLQSIGLSQFVDAGSRVAGIGPAVNLPIFDGGRLRSNLGARNADYDAAVEQYNQTLADALQDVVNQLTSMRWQAEQRREQALAVANSQRAHELAMQRYRAGLGTYLQVLIAESQVEGQKKLLIDLDAGALQLDASLIRALGGGLLES